MATLIIKEGNKSWLRLSHPLYINERCVGILGPVGKVAFKPRKTPLQASLQLPAGEYDVRIQSVFPLFSSTVHVAVADDKPLSLTFSDKEFWWDLIFWVDMAAWILKMILHIGRPWNIVYEVISDVVCAVWLFHEFRIRKNYFKIDIQ